MTWSGVYRWLRVVSVVAGAALLCGGQGKAVPAPRWVGTWACSPQLVEPRNRPPAPGLSGNTLRQVVHLTIGGDELRFKFSNEFGLTPLTLTAVHIALPGALPGAPGAILAGSDRALSFDGSPAVTIPAGAFMLSDPIRFKAAPFSDLVVTFQADRVPDGITGHPGSRETSYLAVGNEVSQAVLTNPVTTDHWYVLDGIAVEAAEASEAPPAAAIIALGDSITDGRGSVTNGNTRWTDYLARDLAAHPQDAGISVLNQGLGGNNVYRPGGLGPTAMSRYDRDVIAQPGVRWVIVFEGVNDIGTSRRDTAGVGTVAGGIIRALQQFIVRAHTRGLLIYGATITPFGGSFYDTPQTEAARDQVNAWIRTSGQFDAVIDFDQVVRDPNHPGRLAPAFDSGDHLHPNSTGYQAMAAAIDLTWFAR